MDSLFKNSNKTKLAGDLLPRDELLADCARGGCGPHPDKEPSWLEPVKIVGALATGALFAYKTHDTRPLSMSLKTLAASTGIAAVSDYFGSGHLERSANIAAQIAQRRLDLGTGLTGIQNELVPVLADSAIISAAGIAGLAGGSLARHNNFGFQFLRKDMKSDKIPPGERFVATAGDSNLVWADEPNVYRQARLYDIAFNYRKIPHEADVLQEWYRRATGNAQLENMIELAAGPGRHAREFAARGIRSSVLDYSPEMVEFSKLEAARNGVTLAAAVHGDMINFAHSPKSDLAITMLDSISHIHTEEDLAAHFASVGRHVKPGGAYIVEMDNPNFVNGTTTKNAWSATENGTTVNIEWGNPADLTDPVTKLRNTTVRMHAQTPEGDVKFTDQVLERHWDQQSIEEAVRRSGLFDMSKMSRYGDFKPDAVYDSATSWRLIYVLPRKIEP